MQCWEAGGSSASPDRWSTGPAVLAGLESTPMRSWIPSVEGIRAELTSVERIRSRAWCKPDMVQGMVQAGYGPGHGASRIWSRAWCKPDMVQGMVQAGYGPGHGASRIRSRAWCKPDTVQGMVQARWWTRNSMGSGPMSVELWEWLRRVDEAQGILEMSGGTWSEAGMALEAGDGARRVWWMRQNVRRLWVYIGAAGMQVQEARG
jgi:hypothetical protein